MSRASTVDRAAGDPTRRRPSPVLDLVREDLRDFAGYRSARSDKVTGEIWLNANESPWANPADPGGMLRRYPDPQPARLRRMMADLYGCQDRQLLAGRGSDEGIDLLVRALCRPGQDGVVVTTPTFGMYAVAARLHGVPVIDVPLDDCQDGFACDFDAVAEATLQHSAKVVFLCSPGNPTGTVLPLPGILALSRRLAGRAVVVVDEAYIEFADGPSAVSSLADHDNLVVLRTLSKVHALAAARIGCVIANPALITVLQRCQAPYPLATPCVEQALMGLDRASVRLTRERLGTVRSQREALRSALASMAGVRRVYPSQGNFVLVRLEQPQRALDRLLGAGVVVRDLRAVPGLADALRVSIGSPEENTRVLEILAGMERQA